jgi:hypothetical protein
LRSGSGSASTRAVTAQRGSPRPESGAAQPPANIRP